MEPQVFEGHKDVAESIARRLNDLGYFTRTTIIERTDNGGATDRVSWSVHVTLPAFDRDMVAHVRAIAKAHFYALKIGEV